MAPKSKATENPDRNMPKLSLHWLFKYVDYYERSIKLKGRRYSFRRFERDAGVSRKVSTDIFERVEALLGGPLLDTVMDTPPPPRRKVEYMPAPDERNRIDKLRGDTLAGSPYFTTVDAERQRSFVSNDLGADVALFAHVVREMWKGLLGSDRTAFRTSALAALRAFASAPNGVQGVASDFRFPKIPGGGTSVEASAVTKDLIGSPEVSQPGPD